MAYVVWGGKLHFRSRVGSGPCLRCRVGKDNRRILCERDGKRYHATKGWRVIPASERPRS